MFFPLGRLPSLALVEVFKSMDLLEIIYLTQASQKTKHLIKTLAKLPIHLKVYYRKHEYLIEFKYPGYQIPLEILQFGVLSISPQEDSSIFKFGKSPKTWAVSDGELEIFWEDKIEGYKAMITYFKDIFDIKSIFIKLHWFTEEHVFSFADFIFVDLRLKVQEAGFTLCNSPPDEEFDYSRLVNYYVKSEIDSLSLKNARYITVEHLCSLMKCSKLRLPRAGLSSEQVGEFLKHLMANPGGNVTFWEISHHHSSFENMNRVMELLGSEVIGENIWKITRESDGVAFKVKWTETTFILEKLA